MGIGFEPPDHPEWTDDDPESSPIGVGQMSTLDGADHDDEEDEGPQTGWWFLNHVYVAFQVGPFAIVLGRPEDV